MANPSLKDSTLIQTSSGKKFASDAQDWKWWHSTVPSTLRKLYMEDGYVDNLNDKTLELKCM
jgi:hypothetical protein